MIEMMMIEITMIDVVMIDRYTPPSRQQPQIAEYHPENPIVIEMEGAVEGKPKGRI